MSFPSPFAGQSFGLVLFAAVAPAAPALRPGVAVLGVLAVLAVVAVALWMRLLYARQTRELRESEERFRGLFENALEGVYENPPEGGFLRVNPAMAHILGFASPAEVLKINPRDTAGLYVSPTRRDEFFAALGTGDQLANFESEIRRPDGTTVWIKENVRAVRDRSGRLLYLQGFVSDISARKQAENALAASEERFRVLFEHLPIGVVEYDYRAVPAWFEELRRDGVTDFERWLDLHPDAMRQGVERVRIVGANPAVFRLLGARDLEQGVANLRLIYTPDVYVARRHIFITIWNGGAEADGELTINTLDGRQVHLYYRWRLPVIEGQPLFERTQLALVDLTDMRTAERALAAERERLAVTLRAMSEGVVTTDPSAVVQFMNAAAGSLTGWSPGAAIGRPLSEVVALRDEKTARPVTPPVTGLRPGAAVDLPPRTVLQRRNGPLRRVEGRCAPIHDAAGRAMGAVLVLRDVTDRLRLEAELVRASKLDSLGILAGGIAHDFNNLLTIVMGNLTLALLDEQTEAASGRWLREAQQGAVRARELTQQLLTFAKGGEPVREAVLLADVVREAAEFALHGAAVGCEFNIGAELRAAAVDKGQIGQVVHNLVINAVQAMPDGGTIRIGLDNETLAEGNLASLPAGDYLRLEITDTGRGIEPEHLARIFEPFFTTKPHGSGLGLATVYSVIHKHGGHVSVESEQGRGTTFLIRLPAAREDPVVAGKSSSPFQRTGGRVLVMDDEEPIRTMTRMLLERLGFEATTTCDGSEAVQEFAAARQAGRPFDVVIMDLTVAGAMGGAEAMREILKVDPQARGIVSSGYSSDPVMANYRAHGFRGMVPKPYRMSEFTRTLHNVLNSE